ncbi:MAG: UvrB/UvrC motif-containing protein [Bacillota bacterium]|nr:UvrB/UvrC motif-containing protein [Bacillota bacterium]
MLCQECRKNEATIHIIKSSDGKQTELFLCEHCAHDRDELDFSYEPKFSLHQLFAGLLNQNLFNNREASSFPGLQCPSCGLTFAQFSQVGRLGCSECFTAFEEQLKPLLRKIHAGCSHRGKIPFRIRTKVLYLREIDELKEDMQQKVLNEKFEEAAVLRDRIRQLEAQIIDTGTVKGENQ